MMDVHAKHIEYIRSTLVPQILQQNECFAGQELVEAQIIPGQVLDGFMSAIHQLELTTRTLNDDKLTSTTKIIVKLMKGDEAFRVATNCYTVFGNEIYYYTKIQPCFEQLLAESTSHHVHVDELTPKVYYGFFGKVPELSNLRESVLAVQDLRPQRFRGGPRLVLDEDHLRLMIGQIGHYHALSYGLKIKNPTRHAQIVDGIVEMKFAPGEGRSTNMYTVLYDIAINRFVAYVKRTEQRRSATFLRDVANLERKYGQQPVALLEHLRRDDGVWSVIQHGDYNRNNVLFRYAEATTFDRPDAIRMFDFQELRYGSPVFDLAFFMYMNSDPDRRPTIWEGLLSSYHETMITTLASIVGCGRDDDLLRPYSYDNFMEHFAKFAIYGAMVCMHFTPWMICPEAHCERLSRLFETDIYGKAFYEVSMIIGGDEADERVTQVLEHASQMGYMKWLED